MNINYDKENLCINCNLKFPKSIKRCTDCRNKLRTSARSWKSKTRIRFKCSSCGHLYGYCDCICCSADEIIV